MQKILKIPKTTQTKQNGFIHQIIIQFMSRIEEVDRLQAPITAIHKSIKVRIVTTVIMNMAIMKIMENIIMDTIRMVNIMRNMRSQAP